MADTVAEIPVVDSHHHFWRLADRGEQSWRTQAHRAIAHDYQPADLRPNLTATGVDATVLVQAAETPEENDRLAGFAVTTDFVAGAVGWLPVTEPERARAELRRLTDRDDRSWLRGVRCGIGRDPVGDLVAGASGALFAELADQGLTWDIVAVTGDHTDSVTKLATALPELRIIVDHLARPPLDDGGWEPWAGRLRALAACPNVALKISVGIDVLTSGWTWDREQLVRYIAHAVRCFGPDRLMLASNWPVVLLGRDYAGTWNDLAECVRAAELSEPETAQVLGGTATRWYGLRHT